MGRRRDATNKPLPDYTPPLADEAEPVAHRGNEAAPIRGPPDADDDAPVFLDLAAVKALVGGTSTSTIYADATFPLPVILSHRRVRWIKHEVVEWMRAKIAARDATAPQRRQELIKRQERRRAKQRAASRTAATTA